MSKGKSTRGRHLAAVPAMTTPSGKPLTAVYFENEADSPEVMLCSLLGLLIALDETDDPGHESPETAYNQQVRRVGLVTSARMLARQLVERINIGPAADEQVAP